MIRSILTITVWSLLVTNTSASLFSASRFKRQIDWGKQIKWYIGDSATRVDSIFMQTVVANGETISTQNGLSISTAPLTEYWFVTGDNYLSELASASTIRLDLQIFREYAILDGAFQNVNPSFTAPSRVEWQSSLLYPEENSIWFEGTDGSLGVPLFIQFEVKERRLSGLAFYLTGLSERPTFVQPSGEFRRAESGPTRSFYSAKTL